MHYYLPITKVAEQFLIYVIVERTVTLKKTIWKYERNRFDFPITYRLV